MRPAASGGVYASYGCVYVFTAILCLRIADKSALASKDLIGRAVGIAGMLIIIPGWGKIV